MAVVDGRGQVRSPQKPTGVSVIDALIATAPSKEAAAPKESHDWPACAIFRGGKCTCDENKKEPTK